jgi:DNA-binding NtrC family response regulator
MSKKLGKNITGISNAAIKEMQAYNWPGNIRELEHMIERAAITSSGIISELGLPEKDSDLVAFPVGGYVQQTLAQHERNAGHRNAQALQRPHPGQGRGGRTARHRAQHPRCPHEKTGHCQKAGFRERIVAAQCG